MEDVLLRVLIQVPSFLLALVVHEFAHGFVALRFGDTTARDYGRLTLNPIPHIDMLGTIILPIALSFVPGGMMFGWAKPVPINARMFRDFRKALFWVSFAGPLSNIILALGAGFLYALMVTKVPTTFYLFEPFKYLLIAAIQVNVVFAIFNLIPFPPLDGSKMVMSFLSYESANKYESLANFSLVFFFILAFTNIFSYLVMPAIALAELYLQWLIRVLY